MADGIDKTCDRCGRRIDPRRRWTGRGPEAWAAVRHCSAACRRRRPGATDRRLEQAILELLAERARSASICPSEAARRVGGPSWRPLLARTRDAARRLAADGRIAITQGGRAVDPSRASGAIRLRRRQGPP